MSRTSILILIIAWLISGCGYHPPGHGNSLPADIETLYIEMFQNLTTEPYLENRLTDQVISQFSRSRLVEVVEDPKMADAVLSGQVTGYSSIALSYNQFDRITEYRSTTYVSSTLRRRADQTVLWQGVLKSSEEYFASIDKEEQEDREGAAQAVAADRLADDLYANVISGF